YLRLVHRRIPDSGPAGGQSPSRSTVLRRQPRTPAHFPKDSTMAAANQPDSEAEVIDKLDALLVSRQRATAPQLRVMHPKTVAGLAAEFRVSDAVPASLAHGIFAKPQTYTAWVRLSNAVVWDDREPDIHGLAIKLLGVPGALLPDPQGEPDAQDILLI